MNRPPVLLPAHAMSSPADLAMGSDGARTPMAYTSFDGDFLSDVLRMCWLTSAHGYVPLNPEAALGYYVSTESHGGQKTEVMRDCVSVEFAADELWIVTEPGPLVVAELAEGVVAEVLLWLEYRRSSPIRHLQWLGPTIDLGAIVTGASAGSMDEALLDPDALAQSIHRLPGLVTDLEESLLADIRARGVRPLAYVVFPTADMKHCDWARRYAYQQGFVPACPSTMLAPAREVLGMSLTEYEDARRSLMSACEEIWVFRRPGGELLDEDMALELDLWAEAVPGGRSRFITWAEAQVPKFVNPRWALTDRERLSPAAGEA